MKYKNIRLIIVLAITFTIVIAGCSISITRNYYSAKPIAPINKDSTNNALNLGTQMYNPNDGQR